jgi:hypothetical protein
MDVDTNFDLDHPMDSPLSQEWHDDGEPLDDYSFYDLDDEPWDDDLHDPYLFIEDAMPQPGDEELIAQDLAYQKMLKEEARAEAKEERAEARKLSREFSQNRAETERLKIKKRNKRYPCHRRSKQGQRMNGPRLGRKLRRPKGTSSLRSMQFEIEAKIAQEKLDDELYLELEAFRESDDNEEELFQTWLKEEEAYEEFLRLQNGPPADAWRHMLAHFPDEEDLVSMDHVA